MFDSYAIRFNEKLRKNRCSSCKGCDKVTSSEQCLWHCDKWFALKVRQVSLRLKRN